MSSVLPHARLQLLCSGALPRRATHAASKRAPAHPRTCRRDSSLAARCIQAIRRSTTGASTSAAAARGTFVTCGAAKARQGRCDQGSLAHYSIAPAPQLACQQSRQHTSSIPAQALLSSWPHQLSVAWHSVPAVPRTLDSPLTWLPAQTAAMTVRNFCAVAARPSPRGTLATASQKKAKVAV